MDLNRTTPYDPETTIIYPVFIDLIQFFQLKINRYIGLPSDFGAPPFVIITRQERTPSGMKIRYGIHDTLRDTKTECFTLEGSWASTVRRMPPTYDHNNNTPNTMYSWTGRWKILYIDPRNHNPMDISIDLSPSHGMPVPTGSQRVQTIDFTGRNINSRFFYKQFYIFLMACWPILFKFAAPMLSDYCNSHRVHVPTRFVGHGDAPDDPSRPPPGIMPDGPDEDGIMWKQLQITDRLLNLLLQISG